MIVQKDLGRTRFMEMILERQQARPRSCPRFSIDFTGRSDGFRLTQQ